MKTITPSSSGTPREELRSFVKSNLRDVKPEKNR